MQKSKIIAKVIQKSCEIHGKVIQKSSASHEGHAIAKNMWSHAVSKGRLREFLGIAED